MLRVESLFSISFCFRCSAEPHFNILQANQHCFNLG